MFVVPLHLDQLLSPVHPIIARMFMQASHRDGKEVREAEGRCTNENLYCYQGAV